MEDQITYQDGDIIISKTLARFGGVSYPTVGIGTMNRRSPDPLTNVCSWQGRTFRVRVFGGWHRAHTP